MLLENSGPVHLEHGLFIEMDFERFQDHLPVLPERLPIPSVVVRAHDRPEPVQLVGRSPEPFMVRDQATGDARARGAADGGSKRRTSPRRMGHREEGGKPSHFRPNLPHRLDS